jgi:hypothetical protein
MRSTAACLLPDVLVCLPYIWGEPAGSSWQTSRAACMSCAKSVATHCGGACAVHAPVLVSRARWLLLVMLAAA